MKRTQQRNRWISTVTVVILSGMIGAEAQETPQVAPAPPPAEATSKPADAAAKPGETPPSLATPAPSPSTLAPSDRDFLQKAAELAATSSELAKLSEKNAGTEEVQSVGQELLAEHTRSIAALREIAKMKGLELTAGPTATQQATISEMAGKIGQTFDNDYRAQVLSNHEEAIRLFSSAAQGAKDPDLRAFAERSLGEMKDRHAAMGGEAVKLKGQMGLKIAKPADPKGKGKTPKDSKASKGPTATAATSATPTPRIPAPPAAPAPSPTATAPATSQTSAVPAMASTPLPTPSTASLSPVAEGAATRLTPGARQTTEPAVSSVTASSVTRIPESQPRSRPASRLASQPLITTDAATPAVEAPVTAQPEDPRSRWTIPAPAAPKRSATRRLSNPEPVASAAVEERVAEPSDPAPRRRAPVVRAASSADFETAPVARVVRSVPAAPAPSRNSSRVIVVNEAGEEITPTRRVIVKEVPVRRSARIFEEDDDDEEDD